ncbi:MAG: EscN/YscN/HrcN family type III secretion system ATPase [Bdellovibrionales bacterium RIFOXYD12_FULL_39_22]|nr:MAG: EscN/YscN/HrcN family type III secretion system ATPase [Bdellovibrionales bacterium RIFOXYB1_FULL_39_21]OFZ42131.1 MAG: EscN/YscN/HrcN family type III secretion system ATPase [Bdellovibrionales bacterium RIFOXYC12_FULL_39_17]OFZ50847.1 MAG: EscN/YscN/HrcN family type III secretion system ATPase [Bdellovibrionales bacterium RIFOXYC1_FULL_39_130]OFZ73313.1 MAG: EscN/YscN/HrcN family type III secretion system ATPase [Bdellovibrionales bacterium RIFOXYC2_FULL_39_8]OFZ78070.1 MAG: EscN/YscN/
MSSALFLPEENNLDLDWQSLHKAYEYASPYKKIGKIHASKGALYEINLSRAVVGATVEFVTEFGSRTEGEVVAISGNRCLAMPYEEISGINSETRIYLKNLSTEINICDEMLGRVIDFQGNPIDGKGPISGKMEKRSIFGHPINPISRPPIKEPLDTGIAAINCFMTAGKGQRMSILSGSGVGKSVLLGMIAQNTNADVNVIALIGERGREVLEFIQNDLGPEGIKRSVVVVATSDTAPLIRMRAAFVATTIAEYFRDQKKDIVLMMDSITRFAMAHREITLAAGEPPGQKGYTPSVFSKLPKLLERAGTKSGVGSITGIYTVLVEGGDMDEPISDAIRAIADGHIVLSRELASRNHFPAIDVLASLSRVMTKVVTNEHRIVASHLKDLLAAYKESEDLINVGAYARGSNPRVDKALVIYHDIMAMLRQEVGLYKKKNIDELYDIMVELARKAENTINMNNLSRSK